MTMQEKDFIHCGLRCRQLEDSAKRDRSGMFDTMIPIERSSNMVKVLRALRG